MFEESLSGIVKKFDEINGRLTIFREEDNRKKYEQMQFTLELNNKITDLHDHFGKEVEEFKEALSTKMINVTNYVSKVEERLKKN